jgi:hypothetical protein
MCAPGTKSSPRNEELAGMRVCNTCPPNTLQWQWGKDVCVTCPAEGIDCSMQTSITVLKGFYRPPDNTVSAVRCPLVDACSGGNMSGVASCNPGHAGVLCGVCLPNFYRSRAACKACPDDIGSTRGVLYGLVTSILVGIFLLIHYTNPLYRQYRPTGSQPLRCLLPHSKAFPCRWRLHLPARLGQDVSTLCKILLGYLQVASVFSSFTYVRWPTIFSSFLSRFSMDLTIELNTVDCVTGGQFTFFSRLALALAAPFMILLVLFLMSVLSVYLHARHIQSWERLLQPDLSGGRTLRSRLTAFGGAMNTPVLWKVVVWFNIFLYPSVSQMTLATFSCVKVRGRHYLRSDPSIICYEAGWNVWAAIALASVLLYCLGMPLLLYCLARAYHNCVDRRAKRVSILIASYQPRYWYFESVE